MPDPYRSFSSGDPIPKDAPTFNAFALAARAERDRLHELTAEARVQTRQGDIVVISNETGADLPRNSVLGLNGPLFTPSDSLDSFLRDVAFRGIVPVTGQEGKFAILLEPAPSGRLARAYVAGVAQVQINVVDVTDTCAELADGATGHLVSVADGGSAQILWKESDDVAYGDLTGIQWAIIRFGTACFQDTDSDGY